MKLENYPKLTIIMRGYSFDQAHAIVQAMAGLEQDFAVEVTLNTPGALSTIQKLTTEFGDHRYIGAGTVLDFDDEVKAIAAGAQFLLGPCTFSKEMIAYAKAKDIITVPAAMTPSETSQMLQDGADIVKVFPATAVGPSYFKAIQGPLGKLKLMAVGGVSKENVHAFFANGASYAGLGSQLFERETLTHLDVAALHETLKSLTEHS